MSFVEPFARWDDLKGASTFALVGEVTHQDVVSEASLFPDRSPGTRAAPPWTISTLSVNTLLVDRLGTRPRTIDEIQLGPVPDGMWVSTFFPLPLLGERYLMFLTPSIGLERYHPVRGFGGIFSVNQADHVNPLTPEYMHGELKFKNAPLNEVIHAIVTTPSSDLVPPI